MVVGSLQETPDTTLGGRVPDPANLTVAQLRRRSTSASISARSLVNSGIFTGGVLLCTVVFGVLAGYALAVLQCRGRGTVFAIDAARADRAVPAADGPAVRA